MTIFRMGKVTIICEYKNSRDGFSHKAILLKNGVEVDSARCHYLNRTWESFPYQSVMRKLVDKTKRMTKTEKTLFSKKHLRSLS